jgi:hypothetical protein
MTTWQEVLNLNIEIYKSIQGSQLRGFLMQEIRKQGPQYLFDGSKELVVLENELKSNSRHSLALLVYAALNPQLVKLGSNYESLLANETTDLQHTPDPGSFFKGNTVQLPKNIALDAAFKSFEAWSATNEVKHISLWLIAALRGLLGTETPSALEVEIPLPGEPRPGRLDVVAMVNSQVICFEAKTSISDAIKDRRFVEQVPKYKKEISSTTMDVGLAGSDPLIFLATGGNEEDLKCVNGSLVTSAIGKKLIRICERHEIKFVTANAIWQILATNLIRPASPIDLVAVLSRLETAENFVGLTSAGYITKDGSVEESVIP